MFGSADKMKKITIILIIIVSVLLTLTTLFLNIIPCRSWYGSNTRILDNAPHNTFCNLMPNSISFGPYNEYYYFTKNPTTAMIITFSVLIIILSLSVLIIHKIRK